VPDIVTCHLPGHSPDCLAVILGEEAVIVGDILLPQITPWPTCVEMYDTIESVVGSMFPEPKEILGLSRYLQVFKGTPAPGQGPSGHEGTAGAPILL
jgi:glyoxylase-like metal-dependent hydrolase (beta-lactamase superfamily II)